MKELHKKIELKIHFLFKKYVKRLSGKQVNRERFILPEEE
jgi:hypothetical protein